MVDERETEAVPLVNEELRVESGRSRLGRCESTPSWILPRK
jgi:hypothetical protein